MVKHRVLAFFALLFLMGSLLFLLQIIRFDGINGLVTQESSPTEVFSVDILEANYKDDVFSIFYEVGSPEISTQEVKIAYTIYDALEMTVKEGESSIVVGPGYSYYTLNLLVPHISDKFSIVLSARDKSETVHDRAVFSEKLFGITGRSIYQSTSGVSYLGLAVVLFFIFGYCLWYLMHHRHAAHLAHGVEGRFIRLHDSR